MNWIQEKSSFEYFLNWIYAQKTVGKQQKRQKTMKNGKKRWELFNCIFYWIELALNNFELSIFLNWILAFSFESKIELNHFQVKFNHCLNRQIVPPSAICSTWPKHVTHDYSLFTKNTISRLKRYFEPVTVHCKVCETALVSVWIKENVFFVRKEGQVGMSVGNDKKKITTRQLDQVFNKDYICE